MAKNQRGRGSAPTVGRSRTPTIIAVVTLLVLVGVIAAAVISAPGHDGRTYVLTGPEAITYDGVAAELSAATGREVEFVDTPDEGARQGMLQAGLPGFAARAEELAARYGERFAPPTSLLSGAPA